jgi:arginine decarboxylase
VIHPTYFGGTSDLAQIVEICHTRGIPVAVDEAHGPHFRFHPRFPMSAVEAGADLIVQSTHKILSAMTQASLLHTQGNLVSRGRVQRALELVQTTSPSYVLMASLDAARRQMATVGHALLDSAINLAERTRAKLNAIDGLYVFGRERCGAGGLYDLDVTKLTINVTGLGFTGFQVLDTLNRRFGVQAEMATLHNVLLIVTLANTQADLDRVIAAFQTLSAESQASGQRSSVVPRSLPLPRTVPLAPLTPREAFFSPSETIPFRASVGRVCAEIVTQYPPGIPILVPGEVISADAVEQLTLVQDRGGLISGPEDVSLHTIKVVRG